MATPSKLGAKDVSIYLRLTNVATCKYLLAVAACVAAVAAILACLLVRLLVLAGCLTVVDTGHSIFSNVIFLLGLKELFSPRSTLEE